jgi:hypothetical protein
VFLIDYLGALDAEPRLKERSLWHGDWRRGIMWSDRCCCSGTRCR